MDQLELLDTSAKALREITEDGTRSKRQQEVLVILKRHGALTGAEIDYYGLKKGLWKRLSELERKGRIRVSGVRKCGVTGKDAKVWTLVRV